MHGNYIVNFQIKPHLPCSVSNLMLPESPIQPIYIINFTKNKVIGLGYKSHLIKFFIKSEQCFVHNLSVIDPLVNDVTN